MGKIFWTGERLAIAAKMWKQGALIAEIARILDTTEDAVSGAANQRRTMFPRRKNYIVRDYGTVEREPDQPAKVMPVHPDRVTRTTISGAKVTLPRVPFIDGYCRSNELSGEAI